MEAEFTAAYERLRSVGYRAAYRLLGDASEAEDIAAESLVRAYVRWKKVHEYPEPFVARVATNLAIDRVRHVQKARQLTPLPPAGSDPATELRLDLQRALLELPRRQRETVALRYLADLTEQQVAQLLGLDVGTVKSHCARGMSKLRSSSLVRETQS